MGYSKRARGAGSVDRTKYGTTRRSTKDFFKYHTQQLATAAVVENAKTMICSLTKLKGKLHSAAPVAPLVSEPRA